MRVRACACACACVRACVRGTTTMLFKEIGKYTYTGGASTGRSTLVQLQERKTHAKNESCIREITAESLRDYFNYTPLKIETSKC